MIAVFLASCAPAAATVTPAPLATAVIAPTALPPTETLPADPTETLVPTPFPIATSRGPHLEATDPTTVQLASGGLQLVEFFEFWWTTCQQMAPMVHGLEAAYFGKIKFSYLEISNPLTEQFRTALGFKYRPSFYLLDGEGNILHQWVGYQTQEQFEEIFTQYVN